MVPSTSCVQSHVGDRPSVRTVGPSGRPRVQYFRPREARGSHGSRGTRLAAKERPSPSRGGDDDIDWSPYAFPVYLQTSQDRGNGCLELGEETCAHALWAHIREEAAADAAAEPLLSSFLYASILTHNTFEQSLAFVVSNRLANATMLPTQLFEVFHSVLKSDRSIKFAAMCDIEACRSRDPACVSYSQALLYFKGYHALQTHRIASKLWRGGQKVMALALQSRMSEVFSVDIHPGACIGPGLLLDHGTGVVIGETAVIGSNCSILQNVTLGGTGKEVGDRHPKLGDGVLVGASASVLGNITIGSGSQIAAGSLVLKPVPEETMVAGSPATIVGKVVGKPALSMQQWCLDEKQGVVLSKQNIGSSLQGGPWSANPDAQPVLSARERVFQGQRTNPSPRMPIRSCTPADLESFNTPGDILSRAASSRASSPAAHSPSWSSPVEPRRNGSAPPPMGSHSHLVPPQSHLNGASSLGGAQASAAATERSPKGTAAAAAAVAVAAAAGAVAAAAAAAEVAGASGRAQNGTAAAPPAAAEPQTKGMNRSGPAAAVAPAAAADVPAETGTAAAAAAAAPKSSAAKAGVSGGMKAAKGTAEVAKGSAPLPASGPAVPPLEFEKLRAKQRKKPDPEYSI